jgi:hypothetical protein
VLDWWRHRPEHPEPELPGYGPERAEHGLDPVRYLLAHRADDLGYGAGLWWGALRRRTLAPLRPVLTGLGGQGLFRRVAEKVTSGAAMCAFRQHAEKPVRLR